MVGNNGMQKWIAFFQDLENDGIYSAYYVFASLIQDALFNIVSVHNVHLKRKTKHAPSWRPIEKYTLPEDHDGRECGIPLDDARFARLSEALEQVVPSDLSDPFVLKPFLVLFDDFLVSLHRTISFDNKREIFEIMRKSNTLRALYNQAL